MHVDTRAISKEKQFGTLIISNKTLDKGHEYQSAQ